MTDPTTPTPPVTARSAREIIREAVKAVEEWAHPYTPAEAALREGYKNVFRKICGTHAALRALLDEPEGSVERLCEAAKMTLEALKDRSGKATINTEWLESALAALRASPESVGGAAPSGRAAEAINTAGRIVREAEAERDEARKLLLDANADWSRKVGALMTERDSLKAALAAAHAELEQADLAAPKATPPPASEAPISERAVTLTRSDFARLTPAEFADKVCAFMQILGPVEILAAAERAAKGEGAT